MVRCRPVRDVEIEPAGAGRSGCGRAGLAAGLVALVVAGCASTGAVQRVEEASRANQALAVELGQRLDALRGELGELRRQLQTARLELEAAVREAEQRQREALGAVERRLGASEQRVESLAGAIRGVEMSVGGLADQVARLETVTAAPPAPPRETKPPRAGTAPPAPTLAAEELFARAMESFKAGELGQAVLDLEDLLARHPSHHLAPVAQYWIGEAYYAARDYEHAAVEYRKAVQMAPRGEKAPEALYRLGLVYRALKRPDRARQAWAELLREFPRSEAAQKARSAARDQLPPRRGPGGEAAPREP